MTVSPNLFSHGRDSAHDMRNRDIQYFDLNLFYMRLMWFLFQIEMNIIWNENEITV